ncbi:MAG: rRNA maturation RNase YbeY [Pseudomonadota bacterium]
MGDRDVVQIDVLRLAPAPAAPDDARIEQVTRDTLGAMEAHGALAVSFVTPTHMADLNGQFRNRPQPTNVLSFMGDARDEHGRPLLGDVVVCPDVVEQEAVEQGKAAADHYVHMLVHGLLHLLGFDHENELDAEKMEARERDILGRLGIADPYRPNNNRTTSDYRTATDV